MASEKEEIEVADDIVSLHTLEVTETPISEQESLPKVTDLVTKEDDIPKAVSEEELIPQVVYYSLIIIITT